MKMTPTRVVYHFGDDGSGYEFDVTSEWRDGLGWKTSVTMTTHGHTTPENGVRHLRHSAEAFLRQLKAVEK